MRDIPTMRCAIKCLVVAVWTEQLVLNCGFRVETPSRSFTVAGEDICSNLIDGMKITAPNQV